MKTERYLGIRPNGEIQWLDVPVHEEPGSISRLHLSDFYEFLGTNCVEMVRIPFGNLVLYVDDIGKLRHPGLPVNPYASALYPGAPLGDPIVGSVVVGCVKPTEPLGELDGFPCCSSYYNFLLSFWRLDGAKYET